MSTYYVEEPINLEKIESHYQVDETGMSVWGALFDFEELDIDSVEDVFIAEDDTCIITKTDNDLIMFFMDTDEFMGKWSEKIWTKFREDSYTTICPKCGEKMAYFVSGRTLTDIGRIEQFHCQGCHFTWVDYFLGDFNA